MGAFAICGHTTTLLHTATHSDTLRYTATHCDTLRRTASAEKEWPVTFVGGFVMCVASMLLRVCICLGD